MTIREYLRQAMIAAEVDHVDCALISLEGGELLKVYSESNPNLDREAVVVDIRLGTIFSIDQYVDGSAELFRIDSPVQPE